MVVGLDWFFVGFVFVCYLRCCDMVTCVFLLV